MVPEKTISLCIPIYNPPPNFFENLHSFLSINLVDELVIIETSEDFSKTNYKDQIKKIAIQQKINLNYSFFSKSKFQHGDSRNDLFSKTTSQFVIFTTQDSDFTNIISLNSEEFKCLIKILKSISILSFRNNPTKPPLKYSNGLPSQKISFSLVFIKP